jgi:hypothetical protein
MDKKKFLDLLKNLQSIMRCPSCGAVYSVEEMQYMGNQDGYFLLSMTCNKCSLPVWVNFFAGEAPGKKISDLTISDMNLSVMEPITDNEVISFHNFISGFDGNFKKMFLK